MHSWGDDWEGWDEIYEAQHYISSYVMKWSRCRVWMKEKWGTLRYEMVVPPWGRVYNVYSIKVPFLSKDVTFTERSIINKYHLGNKGKSPIILWRWCDSWVYKIWLRLGKYMLTRAIKKACIKYPKIKKEILADAYWLRENK